MKRVFKHYEREPYKVLSINEINNQINNLSIEGISLSNKGYWKIDEDNIVEFIYTDYDHPIVLKDNSDLYIDPDYFLDHTNELTDLLCFIIENTKNKELNIFDASLINQKVKEAILRNSNIEKISLGAYSDNAYSLTYDDYLMFKNSHVKSIDTKKVDDTLKDVFDPLINHNYKKNLINFITYSDLVNPKMKYLSINKDLTEEEINNLQYIPNDKILSIYNIEPKNLIIILKKLNELNKNIKVVYNLENKNDFNNIIFNNDFKYDNLYIKESLNEVRFKTYLQMEKLLYSFIEPAKDLSDFEKYIYAYNITKSFKQYKENNENRSQARNLYDIMLNDYMVCVGYAKLFSDLLEKLNIKNIDLSTVVDISYDNIDNNFTDFKEQVNVEKGYHARRRVHIVDPKYGIDGIFITDPTWDNDLFNDLYLHIAMTDDEAKNNRRYLWVQTNDTDELFDIHTMNEFYEKKEFLKKLKDSNFTDKNIAADLFKKIKGLDPEFGKKMLEKYDYLQEDEYGFNSLPDDVSNLLNDLGEYIVSHTNKKIDGKTLFDAIKVVYEKSYGYSEDMLDAKLEEVRQFNELKFLTSFPIRYKIYEDGRKEIIDNIENKFSFELENNKSL